MVDLMENELANIAKFAGTRATGTTCGPWSVLLGTSSTSEDAALAGGAQQATVGTNEAGAVVFAGPRLYSPAAGNPFWMECEFKLGTNASNVAAVFIGFTDNNASAEIPIEDEDGTLETDATDACGWMLEQEQDATWQTVGVATDVDTAQTARTTLSDIINDTWFRMRVVVNGDGSADFWGGYIDSDGYLNQWQKHATVTSAVATTAVLAPVVSFDGRAAAVVAQVRNLIAGGGGRA